jgi:Protein of unknown function (DUF3592)
LSHYFGTIIKKERRKRRLKSSLFANGKIIDNWLKWRQNGLIHFVEVSFLTEQNEEITFIESDGSAFSSYQKGDELEVYYNPNKPNSAGIVKFARYDSNSALYILGGVVMMMFALIYR